MLVIGRALMGRPRVLLLDEPSLGLAPLIAEEVYERLDAIRRSGVTALVVEQNTAMALTVRRALTSWRAAASCLMALPRNWPIIRVSARLISAADLIGFAGRTPSARCARG